MELGLVSKTEQVPKTEQGVCLGYRQHGLVSVGEARTRVDDLAQTQRLNRFSGS